MIQNSGGHTLLYILGLILHTRIVS